MTTATQSAPPKQEPTALLPSGLASPWAYGWLWLLPIGVLLALNLQAWWLVSGNMDANQRGLALLIGAAGVVNALAGMIIGLLARRASQTQHPSARIWWWSGFPAIAIQAAYLWLVTYLAEDVLPRSVVVWIYPETRFLFNQYAFAMLPLFLGIVQTACAIPATGTRRSLAVSAGMALGAPLLLYLGFMAASYTGKYGAVGFIPVVALGVVASIVMFVGVIRAVMLGVVHARRWGLTFERSMVVVVALVLPIAGLLLNRSIPFPVDYQAWEVYALAIANGMILLFADWKRSEAPRLSFNLLCATLPFTLYFFIVLLPFTPLSILAVIFFGLGFLVLTPTFLFALHIFLLAQSHRTLRASGVARSQVLAAGIVCFLLLPSSFGIRGLRDRAALNAALDYVTSPRIEHGALRFDGSRGDLRRALTNHRDYKSGLYYPYLSDFYSWLVFDGLVLPDTRLAQLETVFFGERSKDADADPVRRTDSFFGRGEVRRMTRRRAAAPMPQTVRVEAVEIRNSTASGNTVSTLSLLLRNEGGSPAEYRTKLPVSAGILVNGFRLEVNGTMTPGRIFEKKTALWVYTMIRDSERRDPGLLTYAGPEELELSVFPINPDKPVRVELDLLCPASSRTSDSPPKAHDPAEAISWIRGQLPSQLARTNAGTYLSGPAMADVLPRVDRPIYLHLIVDRSAASGFDGDLAEALRALRDRYPKADGVRITLANHDVVDLLPTRTPFDAVSTVSSRMDKLLPKSGGLALDLAVAHALRLHRDDDLDSPTATGLPPRPVVVVLTRARLTDAPELPVSEAWQDVSGGLDLFAFMPDGSLEKLHRETIAPAPLLRVGNSVRPLVGGTAAFAAGGDDKPVEFWSPKSGLWRTVSDVAVAAPDSRWAQAIALHERAVEHARNPGATTGEAAALVRASRAAGILLPSTSYIVVENEAQWRMLEKSEDTKLGQNAALEFTETPAPPALIVGALFVVCAGLRAWKRRRTVESEI